MSVFISFILITLCIVQSQAFDCVEIDFPSVLVGSKNGEDFLCTATIINEWTLMTGEGEINLNFKVVHGRIKFP